MDEIEDANLETRNLVDKREHESDRERITVLEHARSHSEGLMSQHKRRKTSQGERKRKEARNVIDQLSSLFPPLSPLY